MEKQNYLHFLTVEIWSRKGWLKNASVEQKTTTIVSKCTNDIEFTDYIADGDKWLPSQNQYFRARGWRAYKRLKPSMLYVATVFGKETKINWITSNNSQQGKSDWITGGHFMTALKDHMHKEPSYSPHEIIFSMFSMVLSFNLLFKVMSISYIKHWKYFHFCLSQGLTLIFEPINATS